MKKFIALALALILTASMAACGGAAGSTGGQDSAPDSSGNTAGSGDIPSAPEILLSGEISGEITISCYDTMKYKAFLEDAARLFEEKYPGTKVNIETFSAMPEIKTSEQGGKTMIAVQIQDDPQGRQDYINKTNTALMSGEGADILAKLFEPFYTRSYSRDKAKSGTGLGLYIVRRNLERLGIPYEAGNTGSGFKVSLKLEH